MNSHHLQTLNIWLVEKTDYYKDDDFYCISSNLRHLWASLVAQSIKRLPAMQETRVRSLGWEDPLEKEMATQSCILACIIPWTGKSTVHGVAKESDMT